jgi:tripeptidyl-peptidase-1
MVFPQCPKYSHGTPRADNSLGIFEYGDYYAQEDLDFFFVNYSKNIPPGTHPIPTLIDGAEVPLNISEASGESALDFKIAYLLLYPQAITLYQSDDLYYATNPNSGASGGFNTFLDAIDGSYCTYSAFSRTGDDRKHPPIQAGDISANNPPSGSRSCLPQHKRFK